MKPKPLDEPMTSKVQDESLLRPTRNRVRVLRAAVS